MNYSKIWVTGGLGKSNFESRNFLIDMANDPEFRNEGPKLPEPRVLHCMLPINQTHLFLHGGRKALFPNKNYAKNETIFYEWDISKSNFKIWNFHGIHNESARDSFIFNWNANQWKKVRFK